MKLKEGEVKFANWLVAKGDVQIIAGLAVLCALCAMLSATVLHGGKFEGLALLFSVFFGIAAVICVSVVGAEEYFENDQQ